MAGFSCVIDDESLWLTVGCVCLDVDSTVCMDEGVDELAKFLGRSSIVSDITTRAMNGELDFTEALDLRLRLLQLTSTDIDRFLSCRRPPLTAGFQTLVQRLKANGIHVCLVSGGLLPIVSQVAEALDIPIENVFANKVFFTDDGFYQGFDRSVPLTRSCGKAEVVGHLMERFRTNVLMIGDGLTDAAACPPATFFVGFGGNVDRPVVREATAYFCTDVEQILNLLERVGLLKTTIN